MIDLKRFRKDKGFSQAVYMEILDCKQPYISALENGDRPLSDEAFNKLVSKFGDEIKPYISDIANTKQIIIKKSDLLKTQTKPIPYYDIDFMAGTSEIFNDGKEKPSHYIDILPFNDCDFALPIFGDSMYPQYQNGDIVLCRRLTDKSIIPLGEAFLIVTNEHRMLKYLKKGPKDGTLLAVSENSEQYDPFPIEIDKIQNLFIVKGVIKRKTI